jgi:hypothetical protein
LRAQSRQAVRHSRELHALLTTSAGPSIAHRLSPDWTRWRPLGGRERALPHGGSWVSVHVHPEDQPAAAAEIERAIASRAILTSNHRAPDGSHAYTRALPLVDKAGEITEWLCVVSRLSERAASA